MLFNLCDGGWTTYALDIIVALFFVGATLVCGKKGFFSCILGMVSSLVAFVLAVVLAKAVLDGTGGLFGLQEILAETFEGVFLKMEGFDADISQSGVQAALEQNNVSAIIAQLVLKNTDKAGTIAPGTTLANLVGDATAGLAGTLISGIFIFILVKIVVRLLKRVLNGIADRISPIRGLNVLLGSLFGFVYALVIVSVILAVLAVIPVAAIGEYFSTTLLVGWLFENNPLVYILSWFL